MSFDGMVSGIQNQTIRTKLSATQAMLMNPIAPPEFPATRLKNVVLSDAPCRREANTFLAMLPPHRAWMFCDIEQLNCGHPGLTRLDPSNMPR